MWRLHNNQEYPWRLSNTIRCSSSCWACSLPGTVDRTLIIEAQQLSSDIGSDQHLVMMMQSRHQIMQTWNKMSALDILSLLCFRSAFWCSSFIPWIIRFSTQTRAATFHVVVEALGFLFIRSRECTTETVSFADAFADVTSTVQLYFSHGDFRWSYVFSCCSRIVIRSFWPYAIYISDELTEVTCSKSDSCPSKKLTISFTIFASRQSVRSLRHSYYQKRTKVSQPNGDVKPMVQDGEVSFVYFQRHPQSFPDQNGCHISHQKIEILKHNLLRLFFISVQVTWDRLSMSLSDDKETRDRVANQKTDNWWNGGNVSWQRDCDQ